MLDIIFFLSKELRECYGTQLTLIKETEITLFIWFEKEVMWGDVANHYYHVTVQLETSYQIYEKGRLKHDQKLSLSKKAALDIVRGLSTKKILNITSRERAHLRNRATFYRKKRIFFVNVKDMELLN